ncbi:hypothetical protein RRG08_054129 [Elysia crispata]|uniref:Uncharacterized protein n=1 Tax=Elysia crispata TaxID=231223 RepID=A0AAE1CUA7_9GAST|nr:hypothetical protein RRG08_054129 [Elysia crispata]
MKRESRISEAGFFSASETRKSRSLHTYQGKLGPGSRSVIDLGPASAILDDTVVVLCLKPTHGHDNLTFTAQTGDIKFISTGLSFSFKRCYLKDARLKNTVLFWTTPTTPSSTFRMNGKAHYNLKVAVLGEKQVGKTSLVARYTQNTFNLNYLQTRGGDITDKLIKLEKKLLHVSIIDSAGTRYVRSLIKTLYRDVHGIILVYDVTRRDTFEALDAWMDQISMVNTNNPYILVVGNKADLEGYIQVSAEEARMYAERRDLKHIECSAKTSLGVTVAFDHIVQKTFSSISPSTDPTSTIKLKYSSSSSESTKRWSCCKGS